MIDDYEAFRQKYKTMKSQVEYVLKNYPSTRESDELLWWMVFKTFYGDLAKELGKYMSRGYVPKELLDKIPKFETVTRIRRKLNEQGLYLPRNPEVLERRRKAEKHWRRLMVEEG